MTTTTKTFEFNKNYNDLAQVEQYLPAFLKRLAELEAAGEYRYNDSFKGTIPGIQGEDEDTAIYLLQGLERQLKQDAKVVDLLAQGYEYVDSLDATTKFEQIVLVPQGRMGGQFSQFEQARLTAQDGKPYGVLPKGKRSQGHLIGQRRVLALAG